MTLIISVYVCMYVYISYMHVYRELEELARSLVEEQYTDDGVCFELPAESFLRALITLVLIPGGWDPSVPFELVATLDGTLKGVQNVIIAGFKMCKNLMQNHVFRDQDTAKIHSERFYMPLVGVLAPETKENTLKYFGPFFEALQRVAEHGIELHGHTWRFDIKICTDLKAEVNLIGFGSYHDDIKHCCHDHKVSRNVHVMLCSECKARHAERTDHCGHVDMDLNTEAVDVKIPWKNPYVGNEHYKETMRSIVFEMSPDEIAKPLIARSIDSGLMIRFETEEAIRKAMTTFKDKLSSQSKHGLLQYCITQERRVYWLTVVGIKASTAAWVSRALAVPDVLHLENRIGEEILTRIVNMPLMSLSLSKKQKEQYVVDVQLMIGKILSKSGCVSSFRLNLEKNAKKQTAKFAFEKASMNNDRLRIVFQNMGAIINMDAFKALPAQTTAPLPEITLQWNEVMRILRSDSNMTRAEAWAFQDTVDAWKVIYLKSFPNSDGCYLHMLFRGHIRDYLILHKNLHRYANIDSEAHNGVLKYYLNHRTQRGGHKGGKFNAELAEQGHQTETAAMALCRFYKRRFMWFFDPSVLYRLDVAKAAAGICKRAVVTARRQHDIEETGEKKEYAPANFVHNKELLLSLFPRADAIYQYVNCKCRTCGRQVCTGAAITIADATTPMDTSD